MKNSVFKNKTFYLMLVLCLIIIGAAVYIGNDYGSKPANKNMNSSSYQNKKEDIKKDASAVAKHDKTDKTKVAKKVQDSKKNKCKVKSSLKDSSVANKAKTDNKKNDKSKDNKLAKNTKSNEEKSPAVNSKTSSQAISPASNGEAADANVNEIACFADPLPGKLMTPFSFKGVMSKTLQSVTPHPAIDIAGELGDKVSAAGDGIVKSIVNDHKLGMTVIIQHNPMLSTQYSNLDKKLNVKVGQAVKKGDILGKVGDTARYECEDSAHLHFAVTRNGQYVDPTNYFTDARVAAKYEKLDETSQASTNKVKIEKNDDNMIMVPEQ